MIDEQDLPVKRHAEAGQARRTFRFQLGRILLVIDLFEGLRLGKKSYRLELLYQSEGATFELQFLKPEGRKGQEYYQPELVALLGELDFEWDGQDKYFWVLTDSPAGTMAKLRDLGSRAKALAEQF